MTLPHALLLGLLQGVAEFLPISSSGHLVIAQSLMGLAGPQVAFDVLLHLATLLAVLLYFRRDVARLLAALLPGGEAGARRVVAVVLLATLPTGVIGVAIDHYGQGLFASAPFAAAMLLVTGAILVAAERTRPGAVAMEEVAPGRALLLGVAQGLAVLPGISRSGTTIAAGLAMEMEAVAAARLSFLISVPAILGAVVLESRDLAGAANGGGLLPMAAGAAVAFASGLASIHLLLKLLARRRLWPFALYCWLVGGAVLAGRLL
ncbi:MAG: undecaprenyl-diphosphate phosphatase [Nitrospirae bacterium]|nr:MAG: undecaprenyl-diphosphate phosphatase [Nitrospirota bacterium]